jgi:carbon storage regulator
MLVLSRKCGETVQIGRDITVTLLRIRGQALKIGIDAPSAVRILRGELFLRSELGGSGHSKEPPEDGSRLQRAAISVDG